MEIKLSLSTLLGVATWSLFSTAMAWTSGPCPTSGDPAPCIEVVENGNTYHINGSGQHAGVWYGLPSTGDDFVFQGLGTDLSCSLLNFNCNLTWGARISKCQDSSGDWRIGLKVTSSTFSGSFPCVAFIMEGFPWYSMGETTDISCPLVDSCESFIPYDPASTTLTTQIGNIDMSVFGMAVVADGHLQDVTFNLGNGANFDLLNQQFLDCKEEHQGCYIDTILTLDNATSIEIH